MVNYLMTIEKKLNFTTKLSEGDVKKYCYKDGIFFSPHKFIGGSNTPRRINNT